MPFGGLLIMGGAAAVSAYGNYRNARSQQDAADAQTDFNNRFMELSDEAKKEVLVTIGGGDIEAGKQALLNSRITTSEQMNQTQTTRGSETMRKLWRNPAKVDAMLKMYEDRMSGSTTDTERQDTARSLRDINAAKANLTAGLTAQGGSIPAGGQAALAQLVSNQTMPAVIDMLSGREGAAYDKRSQQLADYLRAAGETADSRRNYNSVTNTTGTRSGSTFDPNANAAMLYNFLAPTGPQQAGPGGSPGWMLAGDLAQTGAQMYANYQGQTRPAGTGFLTGTGTSHYPGGSNA